MPEIQNTVTFAADEPRAVNYIGVVFYDGCKQFVVVARFVFQVGILNENDFAGRGCKPGPESGALPRFRSWKIGLMRSSLSLSSAIISRELSLDPSSTMMSSISNSCRSAANTLATISRMFLFVKAGIITEFLHELFSPALSILPVGVFGRRVVMVSDFLA